MHQNIDIEIQNTEQELKHLGSCTTKGGGVSKSMLALNESIIDIKEH